MINIEVKNLSVDFTMRRSGDRLVALKGVNFSVSPGRFVCVVGPSGCGKTTLLNVFAGLCKPAHGSVLLNQKSVEGPGSDRAMVFQSGALLPWRTVLRNVSYGLEIQGHPVKIAVQQAREMLKLVDLKGFEESYPHELSVGMQQRVNLARALATYPQLLLMDEPFASLDSQMREYMQMEILRIWQHTRQTAIFVTHDIEEAVFLSDEVVVMTARPGTVKSVVSIELPRPRTYEMKKTSVFHEYVDQLRDLVYQEFLIQVDEDKRDG